MFKKLWGIAQQHEIQSDDLRMRHERLLHKQKITRLHNAPHARIDNDTFRRGPIRKHSLRLTTKFDDERHSRNFALLDKHCKRHPNNQN